MREPLNFQQEGACGTRKSWVWHTCQQALNSSVAHVMPFQSGKVLGQEGTHGRIATVWLHWADCVRVVVPGMLPTCTTRIFVDQEETFLKFRRKSRVVTKRKKAVGNTICLCKPCIGLSLRQRVGFGADLVLYVLFLSSVVEISLVFASVAPVALISSSCLRVGLAQAQRAGLMLLFSRKNTCR